LVQRLYNKNQGSPVIIPHRVETGQSIVWKTWKCQDVDGSQGKTLELSSD